MIENEFADRRKFEDSGLLDAIRKEPRNLVLR